METKSGYRWSLTTFCGFEDASGRYKLNRPWIKDGWVYATDGRILVRAKSTEADTPVDTDKPFPDVSELFSPPTGIDLPWPDQVYVKEDGVCPQCCGKGFVGCEQCDDMDRCYWCGGIGYGLIDQCIIVVNAKISPVYDRMIRSLPSVRYYKSEFSHRPVRFIFDGGEG